jgi:hypothetical protein
MVVENLLTTFQPSLGFHATPLPSFPVFPRAFAAMRQLFRIGMLVVPLLACATESIKRAFNLPADTAEKTLKLYSQQSGRALIMGASEVRDIRTREVRGEFTPREALNRMLADTGLEAVEDPESGSLAVRKRARQNSRSSAEVVGADATDAKKKRMTTNPLSKI